MAMIAETLLKDTEIHNLLLNQSELKHCSYDILTQIRLGPNQGEGIVLIYKSKYNNIKLLEKTQQ